MVSDIPFGYIGKPKYVSEIVNNLIFNSPYFIWSKYKTQWRKINQLKSIKVSSIWINPELIKNSLLFQILENCEI